MPRTRRLIPCDSALHIMCRGNNKQVIFNNDNDKLYFWHLMKTLKEKNKISILHYCIMNNHFHLIVWISLMSKLAKFMQQINLSYFCYYKRIYGYSGHIWQGRYKHNIIENDSYLLQCGKYIELNPVRAGMVSLPDDYVFSSYKHYALGQPDALIDNNPAFLGLADSDLQRRQRYKAFVIDNEIINTNRFAKQIFIGSKEFEMGSRQYYGIKAVNPRGGRPRKQSLN